MRGWESATLQGLKRAGLLWPQSEEERDCAEGRVRVECGFRADRGKKMMSHLTPYDRNFNLHFAHTRHTRHTVASVFCGCTQRW